MDVFLPFPPFFTPFLQAKEAGIEGNIKGDGFQNGGLIIVSKGQYEYLGFKSIIYIFVT